MMFALHFGAECVIITKFCIRFRGTHHVYHCKIHVEFNDHSRSNLSIPSVVGSKPVLQIIEDSAPHRFGVNQYIVPQRHLQFSYVSVRKSETEDELPSWRYNPTGNTGVQHGSVTLPNMGHSYTYDEQKTVVPLKLSSTTMASGKGSVLEICL